MCSSRQSEPGPAQADLHSFKQTLGGNFSTKCKGKTQTHKSRTRNIKQKVLVFYIRQGLSNQDSGFGAALRACIFNDKPSPENFDPFLLTMDGSDLPRFRECLSLKQQRNSQSRSSSRADAVLCVGLKFQSLRRQSKV